MKNTLITQKQVIMITALIGLVFVIINLLTIKWYPLPWIDEVYFTDPVANYILTGHYYDTSWKYGSTYPPLYQITLIGWLKMFGFSQIAVRSLNIFIAFVTTIILFFTLHKYGVIKKKSTLIIAAVVFWGSNVLSWMARSGRPDMLTMLIVVVLFLAFYYFKNNKKIGLVLLIVPSIFAPISGIQTIPFIAFIFIWSWITFKSERKLIFRFSITSLAGVIMGTITMMFYFYNLSILDEFIILPLRYSSTFQKILSFIPANIFHDSNFILDKVPHIQDKIPEVSLTFQDKILEIFYKVKNLIHYPFSRKSEHTLYIITNTGLIFYLYIKKIIHHKSIEISLFIYSLLIPYLMVYVAGHYPYYYSWMGLIISLILLVYITDKYSGKIINYTFIVLGLIIFLAYPYNFYKNKKIAYPNVSEFINKQNITGSDYVLSCSMAYYDVRIKTANVYFYSYALFNPKTITARVAPNRVDQKIKSKINYILYDPKSYFANSIQNHMKEFKNNGRTVTLIDSLQTPKLYFYKVEKKYSYKLEK